MSSAAVLTRLTTSMLFEFTVSRLGMSTTTLCPLRLLAAPSGAYAWSMPSTLPSSVAAAFA